MSGKLTTLLENTSNSDDLIAEHGLSIYMETQGHIILFDTGQSNALIHNAGQLGVSLSSVDTIVLSHGHYDHTGGIRSLLQSESPKRVVVGKEFFAPKYAEDRGNTRFIGVDFSLSELTQAGWTCDVAEKSPYPLYDLDDGIWIVTDFPRKDPYELIPERFIQKDQQGVKHPDMFTDEILLVIETSKGLLVIVGCSHPGIINMLTEVKRLFHKPIYGLIGGTHLRSAADDHIDHVAEFFKTESISLLGVSHCTGEHALFRLRNSGLDIFANNTGTVVEW